MDKQTLSNYGWVVIITLILAVLLAMATPFGNFIGDGVVSVANGFFELNTKATDEDNIKNKEDEWMDKLNNGTEDPDNGEDDISNEVYIQDGVEYPPDDELPPIQTGDTYDDGDYIYKYNMFFDESGEWKEHIQQNGWGVRVKDPTKVSYREMKENINGENIVILRNTFANCVNLTQSPKIPDSVKIMYLTFDGCVSLEKAPTIPNGVETLHATFSNCDIMTTTPYLPESVTYIKQAFQNCDNLTTITNFPSKLQNMQNAFTHCLNLKDIPLIPNTVTNMRLTFYNCRSITEIKNLPSNLTNMYYTFGYCVNLEKIPAIPSTVSDISGAFYSCESLQKTIIMDATPSTYTDAFVATEITSVLRSDGTTHPNQQALLDTKIKIQ